MFYQPEVIVYIWLMPVVCFIALPALFASCRITIGALRNNSVPEEKYKRVEQEQTTAIEALA